MVVHLYAIGWNEERIIPFFLRHYEPLVDRIVVYDDASDDRSVELLRASAKVEVRPLIRTKSFLIAHQEVFESCWKESRGHADWVCLVDLDEFLFHPDWHRYLAEQKAAGETMIQPIGYDMITDSFPEVGAHLSTQLTRGQRDYHFDKSSVFDPAAIEQANFTVGRHVCSPVGQVLFEKDRYIQLRHYKSLGLNYLLRRTHALATRVMKDDYAQGWSSHYLRDDDSIRKDFEERLAAAESIPAPPRLPKIKKAKEKKTRRWWQRR